MMRFCCFLILLIIAVAHQAMTTKLETIDQDCDAIPLPSVRQRNKCLTYNDTASYWDSAQSVCHVNGGRLAVVDDAEKLELAVKLVNKFVVDSPNCFKGISLIDRKYSPLMQESVPATPSRVHVGCVINAAKTEFIWQDDQGTPLSFTSALWNTATGSEPSQISHFNEIVVGINPTAGKLHDLPDESRPFICEFVTTVDELRLRCLEMNGRQIGSSCFFVNNTFSTWEQCFDVLAAVGARPARIYTRDIAENLANLLPQGQEYWTGLRKWGATAHWMQDAATPDHSYDIRPKSYVQFTVGDNDLCVKLKAFATGTGYRTDADVACTTSLKCLGEIVGPHQKYKKVSYDQRLTPININGTLASLTLSWPDERACAGECMLRDGCLGFNFNLGMASCELLAFKTDGIPAFGNWNAESGTSFHERHH